jgi:hypothetical protein
MFRTPFKDSCDDKVPTKGSAGTYDNEPNLPSGMPGRTGGMLPEKTRDSHMSPRSPKDRGTQSGALIIKG